MSENDRCQLAEIAEALKQMGFEPAPSEGTPAQNPEAALESAPKELTTDKPAFTEFDASVLALLIQETGALSFSEAVQEGHRQMVEDHRITNSQCRVASNSRGQ